MYMYSHGQESCSCSAFYLPLWVMDSLGIYAVWFYFYDLSIRLRLWLHQ